MNTIPLFGQGRIISELILELVHFFVKKWLEDNRYSDYHITAVDIALYRYWTRKTSVITECGNLQTMTLKASLRSLLCLLFGEFSMNVDISNVEIKAEVSTFVENLKAIIEDPIPSLLYKSAAVNF